MLIFQNILSPDTPNLVNMMLLGRSFFSTNNSSPVSNDMRNEDWYECDSINYIISNSVIFEETATVNITNEVFKRRFFSSNVVNISPNQLSEGDISLLSKNTKIVRTHQKVNG